MKIRRIRFLVGIGAIVCATVVVAAAQRRVKVSFDPGSTRTEYFNNTLTGEGTVDYELEVQAGQKLGVKLLSSNTFLYFNVLDSGGNGEAIADNAREVTIWKGPIVKDSTYVIRVYLVTAEARRNTTPVKYDLSISLRRGAGGDSDSGDQVDVGDLKGSRASSGESELEARGFRNVDALASGNTSYTIWWNGRTRQCIRVATANGRYDSLTDIGTHPKCKDGGGSSGSGSSYGPVDVSDLVGVRASSGESEMQTRGFRNVDALSSANVSYTIWWNPRTRQCIQSATVNGKYDSVTDIQTHPKCR